VASPAAPRRPAGPASYLGAAAREAARQREIGRLEAQVADLDARLGVLDQELDRITADLTVLGNEERAIPTDAERALGVTVATLAERARRRIVCEHDLRKEEERHSENLARRDTAWARFAEYAGAHRFPLHDLDRHGEALDAYRSLAALLPEPPGAATEAAPQSGRPGDGRGG
jgi:hypothetical protein